MADSLESAGQRRCCTDRTRWADPARRENSQPMIKVKALSQKGAFSVEAVTQGIAASDDSKIGSAIPVIPELPFGYSRLLPG